MQVAVVGATGRIGRLTVGALERGGHETVGISRTLGVDVYTGDGLEAAIAGVEAVIDASSDSGVTSDEEAVDFFGRTTQARTGGARRGRPGAVEHRAGHPVT